MATITIQVYRDGAVIYNKVFDQGSPADSGTDVNLPNDSGVFYVKVNKYNSSGACSTVGDFTSSETEVIVYLKSIPAGVSFVRYEGSFLGHTVKQKDKNPWTESCVDPWGGDECIVGPASSSLGAWSTSDYRESITHEKATGGCLFSRYMCGIEVVNIEEWETVGSAYWRLYLVSRYAASVTYHANGGTISGPNVQNYGTGELMSTLGTKPTRSGYQFFGWARAETSPGDITAEQINIEPWKYRSWTWQGISIYARNYPFEYAAATNCSTTNINMYAIWRRYTGLPIRSREYPGRLVTNGQGVILRDE